MKKLTLEELLSYMIIYEGATCKRSGDAFEIISYTSGYQVSAQSNDDFTFLVTNNTPLNKAKLLVLESKIMHKIKDGTTFGLWLDKENASDVYTTLYVDVRSEHFTSIDDAIDFAEKNNQIAIFDWEHMDSFYLK